MKVLQTAERVSDTNASDNFVFKRSLLAYEYASKKVHGDVLEVGSGEGYGLSILAPHAQSYTMLDKYRFDPEKLKGIQNARFIQMTIPPFAGIPDNSFDCVVSFQVIEHIKNDKLYSSEIHRVLKPGGIFIVSTPNIKMSLARNPWHIREYTIDQLKSHLEKDFNSVETLGVYAGPAAMDYYTKNKEAVDKIMRIDFLKLQHRLPRKMLQIPYDVLNRINRKKLLRKNQELTSHLTTSDFFIDKAKDDCLDLYFIAQK